MLNKSGPSTDPWGSPKSNFVELLKLVFTFVLCKRFVNNSYVVSIIQYQNLTHLQYLTKIIETKSVPRKIYQTSGMVHFSEINQALSHYSMLQNISRAATPKLLQRNCLRYLQITSIMGGRGLVSEFMWGIV